MPRLSPAAPSSAEQRQENDREGVEEKQPVAPLGSEIGRTPILMPKRRFFVLRNPGSIVQRLRLPSSNGF